MYVINFRRGQEGYVSFFAEVAVDRRFLKTDRNITKLITTTEGEIEGQEIWTQDKGLWRI
jgi:hypothetical protein